MFYLNALLLGLSTGIFCFTYCAPIFVPQILAENNKHNNWEIFIQFHLGRFIAYIIFGALFGWLGANVHTQFIKNYSQWILALLAFLLIAYGLNLSPPHHRLCSLKYFKKIRLPFVSGFLLGINICPPFLLALIYNFQAGGIKKGILFFAFFFLATTLYFIPLTFLGYLKPRQWLQQSARLAAIAVGLILLGQILL